MSLGLTESEGWKIPRVEGASFRLTNFLKKPERKEDSTFFVGAEIRAWIIAGLVAIGGISLLGYKALEQRENEMTHYTKIVDGILAGRRTSHSQIGYLPIGKGSRLAERNNYTLLVGLQKQN